MMQHNRYQIGQRARALALLLPFSLAVGCASAGSTPNTDTASANEELVCVWEMPTGTHFERRVCRTRKKIEQRRETDQAVIRGAVQR